MDNTAQATKDAVVHGAMGQAVQDETAKTSAEFQDLASSRKVPEQPAATGQPLTEYHSMFYRLLSWKNPRATAITFVSIVALIFASRYLNVLRYFLKATYTVLGAMALAEIAGQTVLGSGVATQVRPKKYWTIRKESLDRFQGDMEQLINFAIIEFQRILFVENVWVTVLAFSSAFISYWLIKWLPIWGLTLIFTCVSFLSPLIYLQNKEFIDAHINKAGEIVSQQAEQVRVMAAQHTDRAAETVRTYTSEYTAKAQEMVRNARGKAGMNGTGGMNGKTASIRTEDMPNAPTKPFPETEKPLAEPQLAM